MNSTIKYTEISKSEVPVGVRFDTPRRNQGQIVTERYGGFGRYENDHGDPYMMIHDASDQTTSFFVRVGFRKHRD